MLFSGIPFLYFFLPLTVLLYALAPRKFKNAVLLLSSMVFYAWGEKRLVFLFAAAIFLGWLLGFPIEKFRSSAWGKFFLWLSALLDLGILCYFKYADFFIANLNAVCGLSIPLLHIALPIGISFYVFQILSYTIDVYRGDVPAQKNIVCFAAYVSMFPQLIAGPIVRYADIADRLRTREHSLTDAACGLRRFLLGLGKKVLIANVLGEVCTDFRASTDVCVLYFWLYAVCFMLQVYFDFSGYSDMAIGLGRLFGFRFAENFQYPYISRSITEFWRRWHISLGTWFRDYVYIPLGGNRHGLARQVLNILIVWMLTGLWHGAAWNFVLWGLYFAVLLVIEKLGFKKVLDRHGAFGHGFVLFAVLLGFILFNADSLAQAGQDVLGLFSFGRLPLVSTEALYALRSNGIVLLAAILGATPLPKALAAKLAETKNGDRVLAVLEPLALTVLLLVVTAYLVDGSFNPFLYFRF